MTRHTAVAVTLLALLLITACAHKHLTTSQVPQTRPAGLVLTVQDHPAPDPRLKLRTWHQGTDFKPYTDRKAWSDRAEYLRQQVLISAGLWPMPEKCDLKPVIHGRIDREDYTVEKVFFQSYPGFYVTGSLYRPRGKTGPFPAVLSPHGHWADGRFYRNSDQGVERELRGGFEKNADAARYPLQARCANLARLGCIVFHYDMVGYADADPQRFVHRSTYRDADAELRGLSVFGLQTWNSIRSLDFIMTLPDVDKNRIACTGASGGGTQTFVLMAADPRLKVAAPVCMISHDEHQGGCVCENGYLLRLGTNNVEIAATFAPKPFVHPTATGDWTAHFMEHGYPEIKATYRLFNAESNVHAVRFTADHNYNLNNRQTVYEFLNTHLRLGQTSPVTERPFSPIEPKALSVFDEQYPRPADSVTPDKLKDFLSQCAKLQVEGLRPHDRSTLRTFRDILTVALQHQLSTDLPKPADIEAQSIATTDHPGLHIEKFLLARKGAPERLPAILFSTTPNPRGPVTLIIHPGGKAALLTEAGAPGPMLDKLLRAGHAVAAVDVFQTGEAKSPIPAAPADNHFPTCYNRTPIANRAHDILTAVAWLNGRPRVKEVNIVGISQAGPWCLLARALAGDAIHRTAADASQFTFDRITDANDDNFLPLALRYGGFGPMVALAAPGELFIHNYTTFDNFRPWLNAAYTAAGAQKKLQMETTATEDAVLQWITR